MITENTTKAALTTDSSAKHKLSKHKVTWFALVVAIAIVLGVYSFGSGNVINISANWANESGPIANAVLKNYLFYAVLCGLAIGALLTLLFWLTGRMFNAGWHMLYLISGLCFGLLITGGIFLWAIPAFL